MKHAHIPVACALLGILGLPARADTLDDIHRRGTLIWGADQEGGGPYVYPDPDNGNRLAGFEVDLADLLASSLGVRAQFSQRDWQTLPSFLEKGEIDIILNGYEWNQERAAQMLASRPYYIYELQLLARENDPRVRSWDDLVVNWPRDRSLPQVAVLGGTAAAAYLHEKWGNKLKIVEYNGNTDAMQQVQTGVHEATLPDNVVAIFYRNRPQGRGLKFVDEPVGRGYYVIFARSADTRLVDALDATIEAALKDGRLKAIYEKYGLWNATQQQLASARPGTASDTIAARGPANLTIPRGTEAVRLYAPLLARAALLTLQISIEAMPLAIILGLLVALGRMYGPAPLKVVLAAYVELLRGTPVMLQLYVLYFILPKLWQDIWQISIDPIVAAVVGLGINYSAYEAEIYRAGLQAIPRGQMEAALSLGMSRWQALRRVIVPQAIRIVVPPVTNDFIALFKDTSVCSVISVVELTKQYNMLLNNNTAAFAGPAAMTALLYMAMSYPLSLLARRMERRLAGDARPVK